MSATKKDNYQRIMLKFSGEALHGKKDNKVDPAIIKNIVNEIKPLIARKVQIGIVIGGGNFFRGAELNQKFVSRVTADHLGMIATMLNALMMRDIFEHLNVSTKIMSSLPIDGIIERYDRKIANDYLNQGKVIIFAAGIGNPLVTTDTALCIRGIELNADLILKATNVAGVYSSDPHTNKKAKLYSKVTYQEILANELSVMDLAAFCLCRDHKMKLRIYNMRKKGALLRIIKGMNEGTLIE